MKEGKCADCSFLPQKTNNNKKNKPIYKCDECGDRARKIKFENEELALCFNCLIIKRDNYNIKTEKNKTTAGWLLMNDVHKKLFYGDVPDYTRYAAAAWREDLERYGVNIKQFLDK